jgi:DNA helicase-2/ATP-dependent DNA helicase PcrA
MSWSASRAETDRASRASGWATTSCIAAFGDGVVTAIEPGGIVVVRFAGDGSERKLMAEYAPITKR